MNSSSPTTAPRRVSLRTTLVALLLTTVALLCLVIVGVTHVSVQRQLSGQLDAQLSRAASRADAPVPDQQSPSSPSGATDLQGPGGGEGEVSLRVVGGTVTEASWRDVAGGVRTVSAADQEILRGVPESSTSGPAHGTDVELSIGHYRVLAHEGRSGETIVTGLPSGQMRSTLGRLDLTLVLASLGALAVAGVAGSLIVRRTLRPLEDVARIASDVATMPLETGSVTLSERAPDEPTRSGREVHDVSRALNRLLDNVEGALDTRHRSEERMRRFIADASHELRTPLTSIRGYTEMLRLTEDLSDRGRQSVDRLDAQSRRMTSLVEDLLLLARLDDGAPRADEEVDLGEVVVEAALDAQVTARGHVWELEVPDEPVLVRGDVRQLTQVVVNLVSNAHKHTPAGTTVHVALGRADADTAQLTVRDDGPGIAPELLGEVFGRFTRADAARSGTDATTGLGLPIVQAIARAHGGSIEVESQPGRTVFTVRLPLAQPE